MLPGGGCLFLNTQCAAVMSRFPARLCTTLAVQKWATSLPLAMVNSAPTAGVPLNGLLCVAGRRPAA